MVGLMFVLNSEKALNSCHRPELSKPQNAGFFGVVLPLLLKVPGLAQRHQLVFAHEWNMNKKCGSFPL
jgi:hypothetical protein